MTETLRPATDQISRDLVDDHDVAADNVVTVRRHATRQRRHPLIRCTRPNHGDKSGG